VLSYTIFNVLLLFIFFIFFIYKRKRVLSYSEKYPDSKDNMCKLIIAWYILKLIHIIWFLEQTTQDAVRHQPTTTA